MNEDHIKALEKYNQVFYDKENIIKGELYKIMRYKDIDIITLSKYLHDMANDIQSYMLKKG